MLPQELIRQKRDGQRLSSDDIRQFIDGVTAARITDYQAAAMLMAIFFRGLDDDELAAWTDAMLHSGDVLDLSSIDRPKIDKHSTGGVGDKISIPLAPAVAACGVAVPMISGRGLGHTGGTLDKLESIPGFRVDLDADTFRRQVDALGTCLIGQTERLAPADRRLYALRDVTATVESIPLIAASIMSKKLAEGIDGLVLDCKVGRGAFMKTLPEARRLADAISAIGRAAGKRVTAVLTDMNAPIGRYIGNALEIRESLAVLRGEGPDDTRELTIHLGAEMLLLAGVVDDCDSGRARIEDVLANGAALDVFRRVVAAQGGDVSAVDEPDQMLPTSAYREVALAPAGGVISGVAAEQLGLAALIVGAGRRRADDRIDPSVGIELACRVGDPVEPKQPLAYLHHNGAGADEALARLQAAITIDDSASATTTRILEVLR